MRVFLLDTTLRDGAQTPGVAFQVGDKRVIAEQLDRLGIDYVEAGWPGANPTDDAFFADPPRLERARLVAFGMTRRTGQRAENDPGLAALLEAKADAVAVVGKASARQAEGVLGIARAENLAMIRDSVAFLAARKREVLFDAEHFFEGFREDPAYALACLAAADEAGAACLVLCDTNGGALAHEVGEVVRMAAERLPEAVLGVHCHDDAGTAVANSLAAVGAGARHVQGTFNGLGERCGNARLSTIIPALMLKMGMETGIGDEGLRRLTHVARLIDERLNRMPDARAPYVGDAAFAHKGGLHGAAVAKDPAAYEHVDPARVGNVRRFVVSDQAGRANLRALLAELGIALAPDDARLGQLLETVKAREFEGLAYDGAEASLEMLARRALGQVPERFALESFRVMDERRLNARGAWVTVSEATVKLSVAGRRMMTVAEGTGPVNALDEALRAALVPAYPELGDMRLTDYKVRILTPEEGTRARIRVMIECVDGTGRRWSTVGVSSDVIDASYQALTDSIAYKLFHERAGT